MLLLTATSKTQGQQPGDFCDAVEGELVVIFSDCHVVAHLDDQLRCREGCPARFFGLSTNERTTTAMVRDVEISSEDFLNANIGYAEAFGSGAHRMLAFRVAWEMVRAATGIVPGTVVGIAGGSLMTRSEPALTCRIARKFVPAIGRALVWARRYEKALEQIDRETRRLGEAAGGADAPPGAPAS